MPSKNADLGYRHCHAVAHRAINALHPQLELIEEQTRELPLGWLFHFGIRTGDPDDPWEYLIGCSNEIFVNRHTGKIEALTEEVPMDWMDINNE